MRVRWSLVGPAVAVVVALAVGLVLASDGRSDDGPSRATQDTRATTAITSDAPRLASLAALVSASDLVVRGRVLATEHGRVFGQPGGASIESRLVSLRVDEVLHATEQAPVTAGATVVVEEPGWLDDGTPIEVDGVPASVEGEEVIWFLQAVPPAALDDPDDPAAYVLVGPQGHYAVAGDHLDAAAGDDPLITGNQALGPTGLADAVRAVVPAPSP
jgi:hypothetical protein